MSRRSSDLDHAVRRVQKAGIDILTPVSITTLVIVHGVGDFAPGAVLAEAARGLDVNTSPDSDCYDLVIDEEHFPCVRLAHPQVQEIVEVNWSAISRPSPRLVSVLDYWVRITAALLALPTSAGQVATCLRICYRFCVEGLLVFCLYPVLASLVLSVFVPGRSTLTFAVGGVFAVAVCALTRYLSRLTRYAWLGWLWAAGIAVAAVLVTTDDLSLSTVTTLATLAYALSQLAVGAFLLLALVETFVHRSISLDRRIATAAVLYAPFFILSAAGAIFWILTLGVSWFATSLPALATPRENLTQWQALFSSTLQRVGYDLAILELTLGGLVFTVGAGLLLVAYGYTGRARIPTPSGENAGAFARRGFRNVLACGAVGIGVLSLVYAVVSAGAVHTPWSDNAWVVYTWSSVRVVPFFLMWPIRSLRVAADVVVDVVFYIVQDHAVSTAGTLRNRLNRVIEHLSSSGRASVIVAAHSQGSIIAVDTLGRTELLSATSATPSVLITAGSPLSSLHARFLGSTPESRAESEGARFVPPRRWLNLTREGDYIGAPIDRPDVTEVSLGVGGHTRYWSDPLLWRHVCRWIDA